MNHEPFVTVGLYVGSPTFSQPGDEPLVQYPSVSVPAVGEVVNYWVDWPDHSGFTFPLEGQPCKIKGTVVRVERDVRHMAGYGQHQMIVQYAAVYLDPIEVQHHVRKPT